MAVKEKNMQATSAMGRRFLFGTNVTVLILLVLFITIVVNFVAQLPDFRSRADLAGGFSSHRLSDRTKQIIDQVNGEIGITTVYISEDPQTSRKEYFPKLRDLCDEMKQYNKNVRVQHMHTGDERAQLRDRVQDMFRTVADEHEKAIELAESTWEGLPGQLEPLEKSIEGVRTDRNAWIGSFTTLARHSAKIGDDVENIEETRKEVEDLVRGEGIPRYQEANNKIKQTNNELKSDLEKARDWFKNMNALAEFLSDADSAFGKRTREELGVGEKLVQALVKAIGDPADTSVPDDPVPVLQDFARSAQAVSGWLVDEVTRINEFAKQTPSIEEHPRWFLRVSQGIFEMQMPLPMLLSEMAESLSGNAERARLALSQQVPKDQLQHEIRRFRQMAGNIETNFGVWKTSIETILTDGTKIDPASKALLALAGQEETFKEVLDKLGEVAKAIDDLPDLELDDLAERIEEDNLVVVECNNDVRIVKFDEVWPIADPMAMRMMADSSEETSRVFDGDSAVSGALLSMANENPFATVIFVGYETQPPPQMRQMGQRPETGPIPMDQLGTLKAKLELANFVTKEWNLGGEGEGADCPQPQEGTVPIYVFLPPASPSPPNPMMRRPPEQQFGEPELEKVRMALARGAGAIFLAAWEPPQMSMRGPMPSSYGYDKFLEDEWGIDVKYDYRLLRVVPDDRELDRFSLDIEQINHLQLSSFTDHPIGDPLRARRMLWLSVCPVEPLKNVPDGVKIAPVLEVRGSARELWAENNAGINRISYALQTGKRGATFDKDPVNSWEPPFSVVLAATKMIEPVAEEDESKKDEEGKTPEAPARESKVVVMGTGLSFIDPFMDRRVPRFRGEGKRARYATDPPPAEDAELFINAVYWLSGKEDMIAAGPVEVPLIPALESGTKQTVFSVTVVWAIVVLVVGGVVMMVRRR